MMVSKMIGKEHDANIDGQGVEDDDDDEDELDGNRMKGYEIKDPDRLNIADYTDFGY